MSQEDGAGEGIPPWFLVKSHFTQFLVNSQCFIPHAEFLKGARMWHLGRKCLRAGPSPALHQDVTCGRWGCILELVQEGDRDLVLLPCFLLPGAICPYHLPMAEARAAHSMFPHAPVCASILVWQSPLATAVAAQSKADFVGRWLAPLTAPGRWALAAGPALPAAWQAQSLKQLFFALL